MRDRTATLIAWCSFPAAARPSIAFSPFVNCWKSALVTASNCLYRIAQEALHNVARHSHARDASVRLTRDQDNLSLEIRDSGIGFDARDPQQIGLGLVSMRERVGFLKGQLTIHASPGKGTQIGVRVPLNPSTPASSPLVSKAA